MATSETIRVERSPVRLVLSPEAAPAMRQGGYSGREVGEAMAAMVNFGGVMRRWPSAPAAGGGGW